MPEATDQPTDRSRRGPLLIVLLAAAIGVGLWYALEGPGTAESVTESQTGDAGTAGATDTAQSPDSDTTGDATAIAAGEAGTAPDTEALVLAPVSDHSVEKTPLEGTPPAEAAGETGVLATIERAVDGLENAIRERIESDAVPPAEDPQAPDPDTTALVDIGEAPEHADPATTKVATLTDAAQATDSSMSPTPAGTRTAETGTAQATDTAQSPDSDTTGDATVIVAGEAGTAPDTEALVLARVPDHSIERTPVEETPSGDATSETGVLATIERAVDRLENAIKERIESDTRLRVQVTYDDSQANASRSDGTPDEASLTAGPDAVPPTEDPHAPDSDAAAPAYVAESPESAGPATTEIATPTDGATPTETATLTESSTPTDSAATTDGAATTASDSTEAEAKEYVETLTDTAPRTIPVDKADHFVTQDHVIALVPEDTIESVSVEELARDKTLSPETPITIVREVEQVETTGPEQLIAESGGDLDKEIHVQVTYDDSQGGSGRGDSEPKVVVEDTVATLSVREALERLQSEPEKPLPVIKTVRYFEVMTLRELLDTEVDDDGFLKVITQSYRIHSATLADLLQRAKAESPDSIFYLHTVQDTDVQGIWGIVQFGLIDNFARGMAIRRGEDVETYTVEIPREADERLEDQSSSFLGLMIDRKSKDSFVYNFRDNRMGQNPDRIFPGQEIVIIKFEPEELMGIYRHFAAS